MIIKRTGLKDLAGLSNLSVGGKIEIKENSSLKTLDNFVDVTCSGKEIKIEKNSKLPTSEAEDFVESLKDNGFKGKVKISGNLD